jgi:hypothetical protein
LLLSRARRFVSSQDDTTLSEPLSDLISQKIKDAVEPVGAAMLQAARIWLFDDFVPHSFRIPQPRWKIFRR